jgi:tetratricopeptide (TPR) repeat protein
MNDASLDEAYTARRSGNVAAALEICRRILVANPADHGAKSLIGLCMAEAGEVGEARPLVEEAVSAEPDNWRFLLNLSVLREIEGRLDDAILRAREAATLASDQFETWGRLGQLCGKQGDLDGAVAALERAVALKPDHAGLALLLAGAAFEKRQYDLSASALDKFEEIAPGRPEALRLRAHLARKRNDWDGFVEMASRWLAADPASEEARVALAFGHSQHDDYHAAVEVYAPLAAASPEDADHAAMFGRYLLWSRDFVAAERSYSRALAARPGHAAAAAGLARLKNFRGQFGEAAKFARKAIEADPANVDGYAQLLLADRSQFSEEDLARLDELAMDPSVNDENRALAWFTIGDVYHRRGEHDRAFDAWKQANELKQRAAAQWANWRYDRDATEKLVDRLVASFDKPPPATVPAADGRSKPILIVGMPRSGTTLLDSALGGHSDISSGGELPAMPSILTIFLEWADAAQWEGGVIPDPIVRQMRESYSRQYDDYKIEGAAFVTDKNPLNIMSVGLIRHVFPEAPIIHIRRNPLETGFSIYRNNFTKSWRYSTALEDIGHYYGQYARVMDHWQGVLGDGMATVQYEQLVCDFEGELRRLLAYIGLDWDPECLAYFERDSVVTTLSSAQVRKPPSRELMSSTTPYLRALQPLKEALERAGVKFPRIEA